MRQTPAHDGNRDELLRALEHGHAHGIYACYQCGKCTAACPFSFSPQRVMRELQLGRIEQALESETTWVCASCLTCSRVCPRDADPAGVLRALRDLREAAPDGESGELAQLASAEFRRRNHPVRGFVFAHIHEISRGGSRLAPLSNWAAHVPGSRLVAHHLLGIHKERALPVFASPSFPDWFARRAAGQEGRHGRVVLFHDTFMDFDAPAIGVAATELLELAGYGVVLSDTLCCGRPMISKGYLDRARQRARANVERLQRQLERAVAIVGCEPSCLLTVREEYPRLLAGTELESAAREVAARCRLVDEFLDDAGEAGRLDLAFETDGSPELLFHGHCQQKAEADAELSLKLLRQAGFRAEMVRAPCCGMAGAFGFEREHYEASRAAFARALGPALAARPDALPVVVGISCRKQIEHFAGRPVRHLVEVLRSAARSTAAEDRSSLSASAASPAS